MITIFSLSWPMNTPFGLVMDLLLSSGLGCSRRLGAVTIFDSMLQVYKTILPQYLIFQSHVLPLRSGRSSASDYFSGAEDDAIQGWVGKNFSKGDVGKIATMYLIVPMKL